MWKIAAVNLCPLATHRRKTKRDGNHAPLHAKVVNLANPACLCVESEMALDRLLSRAELRRANHQRPREEDCNESAHRSNENKMSDGHRERAWAAVNVRKPLEM